MPKTTQLRHLFSTAKHGTFLEENITTTVDHRCHAKQRWSTIATTDGYHYHQPTIPSHPIPHHAQPSPRNSKLFLFCDVRRTASIIHAPPVTHHRATTAAHSPVRDAAPSTASAPTRSFPSSPPPPISLLSPPSASLLGRRERKKKVLGQKKK